MRLNGKLAVVTGGTRGVGAGIARAFAEAGAEVVTCARRPPEVPLKGAEFIPLDVRDADAVHRFFADLPRVDVLVNNVGGTPYRPLAETDARRHARVVELNLIAPLTVSLAAHEHLRRARGTIVMIGSVSGGRPSPGSAAYGAGKAGLEHLARSMAVEWAPEIRVNTLVLGMVRTELSHLHYGDEQGIAAVARTVPLGRLAAPSDVGDAAVFLASDAASYITGASLHVHGGGERPAFLNAATANKQRPPTTAEPTGPTAEPRRPGEKRPATGTRTPATATRRPTAGTSRPTTGDERTDLDAPHTTPDTSAHERPGTAEADEARRPPGAGAADGP